MVSRSCLEKGFCVRKVKSQTYSFPFHLYDDYLIPESWLTFQHEAIAPKELNLEGLTLLIAGLSSQIKSSLKALFKRKISPLARTLSLTLPPCHLMDILSLKNSFKISLIWGDKPATRAQIYLKDLAPLWDRCVEEINTLALNLGFKEMIRQFS